MAYLEYELETRQVVEIHDSQPEGVREGYAFARSGDFGPGDEFENTIWVNEVAFDEEAEDYYITSYSAIRNNPNANRLLRENSELKELLADLAELVLFGGAN